MGAITSSSVAALGSGYSANQNLKVDQGGNTTARVIVLTVDGAGVPLTYILPSDINLPPQQLSFRGCGYTAQNNVSTSNFASQSGSGFRVNILTVGPGSDATHGVGNSFDTTGTGGAGYAVNDTGLLTQGANNSAPYRVVGVSGGVLIAFFTAGGDGYALGVASFINGGPQPGSGSGATCVIDGINPCGFTPSAGYANRVFGGPSNQGPP